MVAYPGLAEFISTLGCALLRLMDKILHDPKDPKLWELWYIFLIMGNAGFCPSTVVRGVKYTI